MSDQTATPLRQVRWVANLHVLFQELPLLERPSAARAAGFTEVEYWWPFDGVPTPSTESVDRLVEAITSADVHLTAMNLYAGTMAEGDRGVVSHPDRAGAFRASVDVAMSIASRLGTRLFNVPYGRRVAGVPAEEQDAAAVDGLTYAARAAEAVGGTILVEPLSGFEDYPMKTCQAALRVIEAVRTASGQTNVALLMDQYHLATNGQDVFADLDLVMPFLRHVQIADVPGRGAPGTAHGRVRDFVEELLRRGYDGAVALEYVPTGSTEDSLRTWRGAFGLS